MRTLTLHTADELAVRWKRRAVELEGTNAYEQGKAQGYRVCAAELLAIVAVSMELEAAHHGDPEVDRFPSDDAEDADAANALLDWSQGRRP